MCLRFIGPENMKPSQIRQRWGRIEDFVAEDPAGTDDTEYAILSGLLLARYGAALTTGDVEAAWRLIQPHVRRTPALELPAGSLGLRAPVALKLESLQVSGSFKGRGAFHKLLASKVPAAGIIAASGGNHGAATAYAARALGHKAEIFVPTIASPTKVARLRSYGAVVHQIGAVGRQRGQDGVRTQYAVLAFHADDGRGVGIPGGGSHALTLEQ